MLTDEEFNSLYISCSSNLKSAVGIAINTGMRRGEILNLKWEEVDLTEKYIMVLNSKNSESRMIPINTDLLKLLSELKQDPVYQYVICDKAGNQLKTFKNSFYSALKKSGIKYCRFHDLRHTFASRLVMGGVDIVTVKELMGHKDINMTLRYSHPTPEHKKSAVEEINIINFSEIKNVFNVI